MNAKAAHNIDARSAELLARQINSAYMNACGYGIDHPMTERSCASAHQSLKAALDSDPMLSLILDRGALFVEKHPVGARFNSKRLIDSFNEIGLESLTFDAGVTESDIGALIEVLSTLLDYDSLEQAEADLKRRQSGAIRLNYIVYRKVTSDQKVVGGDAPGDDPGEPLKNSRPAATASIGGGRVLDQLDSFFSLGNLAGDPDGVADQVAASADDGDEAKRTKLVEHLKKLVHEVEMGGGELEGLSPEELFTAMNTLRQRVRKSVTVHEDVDRIMSESGEVVSEVDELTYSTLVSLVREEYRSGNFSVQRMAQIINRMLPDAGDLKRLLPRLRKGLVEEGMPLDQYAELVHELSTELRGEHLVRALETGAENVGLDVDELVRQIQEDPTEAARLVVLANELRRGGVGDKQQLSSAFTDYIERVSQQLAMSTFDGDNALDAGTLGDQISRVQQELLGRMNESGLSPEASRQLEEELKQRLPELRERSKLDLFERLLAKKNELTDTQVLDWLEKQVENAGELEAMSDAIAGRLQNHGYTPEQATELLERLDERLKTEPRKARIPATVLNVANTALFLKHEVRAAQRYGNPFSVIKLMIERLVPTGKGQPRAPRRSDMPELLPPLYARIIRLARDLDLVGSLEKSQRAVPMIILPMTDETGARVFRQRLIDVLAEFPFRLDGGEVQLECTVTALGFDADTDEDANGFVKRLNDLHQANRAQTVQTDAEAAQDPRASGAAT